MACTLKAIALGICAALTLGALSVAIAPAADLHSENAHTIFKGAQHAGEDTFTFNAETARCNEVTYEGTQAAATTSTVTVTPTYTKCTAFGYIGATVDTNGCGYQFHTEADTVNPVTGSGAGKVTIECPAGKAITFTAPGICEVKIGAQGPLVGITYTNAGPHASTGRGFTIDANISGLKYEQYNKGFCITKYDYTNGTYVGSTMVQGKDTDNKPVGIWLH